VDSYLRSYQQFQAEEVLIADEIQLALTFSSSQPHHLYGDADEAKTLK
jgi:hypothetical protein